MSNKICRILTSTLIAVFTLLAVPSAESQQETRSKIDIHFRAQERNLTLHEPVVVFFEVNNRLSEPIDITVGSLSRQFFELTLRTPSGQVLHKDSFGGAADTVTVGTGKVTVEAGGEYSEPLVVNRWFPFTTEGSYVLNAELTSNVETANGTFQAEPQSIEFQIGQRNPAKLKDFCRRLAEAAEAASSVAAAKLPVLTLSYVNDPIAVPFLVQILSAHVLAYQDAVLGLERIGNNEAVEALLSMLNEKYGDVSFLAMQSLARLQEKISDPRLKQTVVRAVEQSKARAHDDRVKTSISYLEYRDSSVQIAAMQSLKDKDALQKAEPTLQRLIADPSQPSEVVTAAKEALNRLHSMK
jgi:hypothetical protein